MVHEGFTILCISCILENLHNEGLQKGKKKKKNVEENLVLSP